jgi:hypothetical protein
MNQALIETLLVELPIAEMPLFARFFAVAEEIGEGGSPR